MIKKLLVPLATGIWCAATIGLFTSTASAVDVVNDTWRDTNRDTPASPIYSETGTDSDADGNLESAWFIANASANSVLDDATPGGDQMFRVVMPVNGTSSAQWSTYFTSNSAVTLASAGDKLRVTWKFTPSSVAPIANNSSQNFRLCVADQPTATARLTSDGSPPSAAYTGYAVFMNMGNTNLGGSAFQLKTRQTPGTAGDLLATSGNWSNLAVTATAPFTNGYTYGTNYTFVFEFTRINGSDLEVIASMNGGNLGTNGQLKLTYTNSPAQTFSFDCFSVRPSGAQTTAETWDNTLFKVETFTGCSPGTSFNVTGTGSFCPGDPGLPVSLSGSEVGVVYQLKRGGVDTGSPTNGTGSSINFGLQPTAGVYTVVASNATTTCVGAMNGSAILSTNSPPTISVQPSPADATNSAGDSRTFSVTATGTGPFTYQWRTNGVNLVNGGNISGATSNALTIANLTTVNAGTYHVVVSGACSPSVTSAAATLTVTTVPGDLFRSVTSGTWDDVNTWEQSSNGVAWFTPANTPPTSSASNIIVQTGHVVMITTDTTVDQVTVQAGAFVNVQGGNLIINNGPGVDFNVAGTLEVTGLLGDILVGSSALQFQNGGLFNWNRNNNPAVPLATWQDGSTCRISATAIGFATGISGQNFYDFVYDTTATGQSVRSRLDILGTATTIRRDFSITIPDTGGASVSVNSGTNGVLTVGRDVTFVTGASASSTKVLLNNTNGESFLFKVGRNFSATGIIDGFSGGCSAVMEFTGAGTHTLTLPVQPNIVNSGAMNWVVDNGSTLQLASPIDGFNSFTNNGTLTFGTNQIIRGDTLVFNSGGLVNGNGTNYIATNVDTFVSGGTINLGTLPPLALGNSFQFINATTYTGTFGTLLPATPDGTHVWDVSQLNTAATLTVANPGAGPATNPTNIVSSFAGGNLTLSWPTDHIGWTLQTQTNSRSVGLTPATNAWFNVSGSTTTNSMVIPASTANPTVFFRLKL